MLSLGLAFVIGTFGFNYQVTIALMAREVFDLGAEAFGLLSTFFAVGSLTGALLSTRRSARPRQRFLVGSAVIFGVLTIVAGLMPGFVVVRRAARARPARPRWCSPSPTTATCNSASIRRCAAGSWRCTSCASWAGPRWVRR